MIKTQQLQINKTQNLTSEYIENKVIEKLLVDNDYLSLDDLLRWAIVEITDDFYQVLVSYDCKT